MSDEKRWTVGGLFAAGVVTVLYAMWRGSRRFYNWYNKY